MNFLKRSLISIGNRKSRSILFLLLFTIVFSLILSGFAIQKAASQEKVNARKSLGAEVRLKRDSKKMQKEIMKGNFSVKSVSKETVDKIGRLPQVNNTYISGTARAEESGLSYVKPKANNLGGDMELPSTGVSPTFEVEGTTSLSNSTDFKNHDSKMIEGKGITKETATNSAVVEETFAKNNKLKVGDTFNLKGTSLENKGGNLTLKVIGIYKSEKTPSPLQEQVKFGLPQNKIYMDFKSFVKLSDQAGIDDVSYNLKDPLLIDDFKKQANQILGKDGAPYMLDAHSEEYESMVGPIEKMNSFSEIMIKVIIVAGAIILLLLILLSIKERKSELGILLALGEGKRNIVLQLIMETALLAIVSFMFSTCLIQSTGQQISNSILASQVNKEKSSDSNSRKDAAYDDIEAGYDRSKENVKTIDKIPVSLDRKIITKSALIGLFLVLLSTIIPGTLISRIDPKHLFSQKE